MEDNQGEKSKGQRCVHNHVKKGGQLGWGLMGLEDQSLQQSNPILPQEPRAKLTVGEQKGDFLIDRGHLFHPQHYSNQTFIPNSDGNGILWNSGAAALFGAIRVYDRRCPVHKFLYDPKCPIPPLGWDLLSKQRAQITFLLEEQQLHLQVPWEYAWQSLAQDQSKPEPVWSQEESRRARWALPVRI